MADEPLNTVFLNDKIDRIRQGDPSASNDLIRKAQYCLEKVAARMLRGFPAVERWEQPQDVLQSAMLRLLRALEAVRPRDTREFYVLAAEQIRRELIDLVRHYAGREGIGSNYSSGVLEPQAKGQPPAVEPLTQNEVEHFDQWRAFHEAVAELPEEIRNVFGLRYYHGWHINQIAELFELNERTVRRMWNDACAQLKVRLNGDWPDPE